MSTSQVHLITAELQSVRAELAESFLHLKDEDLPWAPAAGMRTIQGIFVEIIATEIALMEKVRGGQPTAYEAIESPLKALATVECLTKKLEEVREETLSQLIEGDLTRVIEFSPSMKAVFCLGEVPASEVFRYVARHEAYHTGQLFSYLWAKGDNPYLWED